MAHSIAPGRPETLTEAQEASLRELWAAALRVFKVYDASNEVTPNGSAHTPVTDAETTTTAERARADTGGSDKKKKRLSFFGRRVADKEDETNGQMHNKNYIHDGNAQHDQDDKYGQTKEFHNALASQTPEELRSAFWSMVKHDHPDALLLRFLRARKWDVQKALIMLISTMHWRAKEMHVDDIIMKEGEEWAVKAISSDDKIAQRRGQDFLAQIRMGKSFLHGRDAEGRPICFVRVRLHRQGEQSEESLERYTVFVIETARLLLSSNVDTAAIVFDMTGFSMANMDYAPVKFMIKCFEANYPESLGVVLVYKSPWIFQGIWSIIKGWLDPVVASKVHFVKTVEELDHYIPRERIPKELDGGEEWSYSYAESVVGENDIMQDDKARSQLLAQREAEVQKFEKATISWISKQNDPSVAKNERNDVARSLHDNYWRLDPYLRGRTLYDRAGIIKNGGLIDFYPTPSSAPITDQTHPASDDDVD